MAGMVASKIRCLVKDSASKDVFTPPSEVVNDVLLNELTDAPCPSLPCVESLKRTANLFRQQFRPQDPKDLHFKLETEHICDNFFREDKGKNVGYFSMSYLHPGENFVYRG